MGSKTILIAAGDDPKTKSLPNLFRDQGYRVETAKVVKDILRKARSGHVDVILLEDGIDGVKACDLVRLLGENSRIQFIVVSSEGSIELARQLRRAGVFYNAMIPLDLEEIRSAVECAFKKIEREGLREKRFPFFVPQLQRVPA